MSIREQMANSTRGITGVTGERPGGGGTPKPQVGYQIGNRKASRLTKIGHQALDATRSDVSKKVVSAPMGDTSTRVDQTWKGAPSSVMHVRAGGLPPLNSKVP